MARFSLGVAFVFLPSSALAAHYGDFILGPVVTAVPGTCSLAGDPCNRGTIFNALKVVRAYRDNEAFAFKHLEGKQLEISGRLVGVKRHKIVVNDVTSFEGFVALVTPDGKPPKPLGLDFAFHWPR